MSIGGLYDGIDMAKLMMGNRAFQIGINIISTDYGNGKVSGVFQTSQGQPLISGLKTGHVLMLGDAIIRPRIIVGSDEFNGYGFSNLAKEGFLEINKWVETGTFIYKDFS